MLIPGRWLEGTEHGPRSAPALCRLVEWVRTFQQPPPPRGSLGGTGHPAEAVSRNH